MVGAPAILRTVPTPPVPIRVILIEKISEFPIVHVLNLFPLLHRFQNTFCFLYSSTPSHGGSFFLKIAIYNGDMAGGISNNQFWAITFDWSDLWT